MCMYGVHMQVYLATTTTDLKSTDNGESRTRLEARVEAAGSAAASHNPCQARLENEKAVGRLVGDFSFCASALLTTTHSEHPGSVMAWHGMADQDQGGGKGANWRALVTILLNIRLGAVDC